MIAGMARSYTQHGVCRWRRSNCLFGYPVRAISLSLLRAPLRRERDLIGLGRGQARHDISGRNGAMPFANKLALRRAHSTGPDLALASGDFQRNVRMRRMPRSAGLVEAKFQGLSDMDVARAAMGHGWPFAACP